MFGMVAGPIMGIYILGMFTMTANEPVSFFFFFTQNFNATTIKKINKNQRW